MATQAMNLGIRGIYTKRLALVAFLDIEGVFKNVTTREAILGYLDNQGVHEALKRLRICFPSRQ